MSARDRKPRALGGVEAGGASGGWRGRGWERRASTFLKADSKFEVVPLGCAHTSTSKQDLELPGWRPLCLIHPIGGGQFSASASKFDYD